MKKYFPTLLLIPLLAAAAAAEDCAKNADACSQSGKKLSPFVQASLREARTPDPAGKPGAALRQAPPAKPRAELKPAPVPSAAAVSSAPAAAAPAAPAKEGLSSPLWLFFVAGSLAGLYFYLRGGTKRGRKR